jgi:hypothetical protein
MSGPHSGNNEQYHHKGCDAWVLEMEGAGAPKMLVAFYQSVQCHISNNILLTPAVPPITYPYIN